MDNIDKAFGLKRKRHHLAGSAFNHSNKITVGGAPILATNSGFLRNHRKNVYAALQGSVFPDSDASISTGVAANLNFRQATVSGAFTTGIAPHRLYTVSWLHFGWQV